MSTSTTGRCSSCRWRCRMRRSARPPGRAICSASLLHFANCLLAYGLYRALLRPAGHGGGAGAALRRPPGLLGGGAVGVRRRRAGRDVLHARDRAPARSPRRAAAGGRGCASAAAAALRAVVQGVRRARRGDGRGLRPGRGARPRLAPAAGACAGATPRSCRRCCSTLALRLRALGGALPGVEAVPPDARRDGAQRGGAAAAVRRRPGSGPFDLNMYHDFDAVHSLAAPRFAAGAPARDRGAPAASPPPRAGIGRRRSASLWAAIAVAPHLLIRWPQLNVFAERYLYLPSIGIFLAVGYGWERVRRAPRRAGAARRRRWRLVGAAGRCSSSSTSAARATGATS